MTRKKFIKHCMSYCISKRASIQMANEVRDKFGIYDAGYDCLIFAAIVRGQIK